MDSSASSDASAARTFLKVRVNLRAFLRLQINLRQPRLVINRHGGLVFLGLQDVVNVNVVAEHGLRVFVAAFNRRAGEADERRLGQRIAHVLGEAVNEIVLVAMACPASSNQRFVKYSGLRRDVARSLKLRYKRLLAAWYPVRNLHPHNRTKRE